jgi:hypothetical protein
MLVFVHEIGSNTSQTKFVEKKTAYQGEVTTTESCYEGYISFATENRNHFICTFVFTEKLAKDFWKTGLTALESGLE